MGRVLDSFAAVCLFLVMLPMAYILTIGSLVRDLGTSLRNIWSKP